MGMVLVLKRITDRDLAQLQACPKAVHRFLVGDEPSVIQEENKNITLLNRLLRIIGKAPDPSKIVFESYDFDEEFDADKMWHGLYYLLTETAWEGDAPFCYLLNAPSIGNEEVAYGPAMAISASQTKELNRHLEDMDRQSLLARFNAERMNELEIYPDIWDEDVEKLKAELGEAFDMLKAYCQKCAYHGLGMVSYIT